MTIVACKECGHGVSTQAVSCPNCGAPASGASAPSSPRSGTWQRSMMVLAALAVIAAALWLAPAAHRERPSAARVAEPAAAGSAASPTRPVPLAPAPAAGNAVARVYVITAEQLYREYSANAVAIQNRIGNGLVRVTGNITGIDEDAAGHPVVRLSTGGTDGADMLLEDDQRDAAAQLSKGESVDIQCEKIQRDPQGNSGAPQGIGCVLARVDAGAEPVYPAVTAKVAAAKPAGRKPAARKSAGSGEARDGAAITAAVVPDVPALPSLEGRGAAVPIPVVTAFQSASASGGGESVAAPPVASFEGASMSSSPDVTAPAGKEATRLAPEIPAPALPAAPPAVAAPGAAPGATAAVPEDLAAVKARDPAAADRIASYCDSATAAAKDHETVATGCRHEEEAAWKRLVVNNEFPALDAAMRSKCNEPPFPDSYVAKESCARYQLNAK